MAQSEHPPEYVSQLLVLNTVSENSRRRRKHN